MTLCASDQRDMSTVVRDWSKRGFTNCIWIGQLSGSRFMGFDAWPTHAPGFIAFAGIASSGQ